MKTSILRVYLCVFLSLVCFSSKSFAQRNFGNEWIDYSKNYYKVKVTVDGMYRILATDLTNAGLDVNNINLQNIQLFHKGNEVPINVKLNGANLDFVEFFGFRNDASLDTVLYEKPQWMSHRNRSLYSDSSAYFLIVGNSPGKRYAFTYYNPIQSFSPQTYYYEELSKFYTNAYYDGRYIFPQFTFGSSEYWDGEGWMSNIVSYNTQTKVQGLLLDSINTDNGVSTGNLPELDFKLCGKSDFDKQALDHHIIIETSIDKFNWKTLLDTQFNGYESIAKRIKLSYNDIGSKRTYLRFRCLGVNNSPDAFALAYYTLRYPRKFLATNTDGRLRKFSNPTGLDSTSHLAYYGGIAGLPDAFSIIDVNNGLISVGVKSNDTLHFNVRNSVKQSRLFIWKGNYLTNISKPKRVYWSGYNITSGANLLIVTHHSLRTSVAEYANYKLNQKIDSVKNFIPATVFTENLYDEFYYGFHHSAAVQNFLMYAWKRSINKPKYVFLIGKGWQNDVSYANYSKDLVPVVGVPSSDLMLVAGIDNSFSIPDTNLAPVLVVGRLSCNSNGEFYNYLNKLKENDATTGKDWKKEVVEIAGGYGDEQFVNNVKIMKSLSEIIAGKYAGAKPRIYSSNNSDPVVKDLKTAIQNDINNGCGMLSYLAHGSLNTLGVDIGDTLTLKNAGKYPIIFINGCNVGNHGYSASSLGEWYIVAKNKGALAWLSHSNITLDNVVPIQMTSFYRNLSTDNFGKSLGETYVKTISDMKVDIDNGPEFRALTYQWVLQGDPTLPFPFPTLPDYDIANDRLSINPENVLSTDDTFSVVANAKNLGKFSDDSVLVRIIHTKPGNKKDTILNLIPSFGASKSLGFKIFVKDSKIQGQNKFEFTFDPNDEVSELSKNNNSATIEYYVAGTGIRQLFPLDFGIVPSDTPTLSVQNRNIFDTTSGVYFELDTISGFNSLLLKKSAIIQNSSLLSWKPQLSVYKNGILKDTQVYYWRSRLNLPQDSGGQWEFHSFTYIKGSALGWSQSHFPQYEGITSKGINTDTVKRIFKYLTKNRGITLTNNSIEFRGLGIKTDDGEILNFNVKTDRNIILVHFDKRSLAEQRIPKNFDYTTRACGCLDPQCTQYACLDSFPVYYLQFQMNLSNERARFVKYVNTIPKGNYIALMTRRQEPHTQLYDSATISALYKLGAVTLAEMAKTKKSFLNTGYGVIGIKGDSLGTTVMEDSIYDNIAALRPDLSDLIKLRVIMEGIDNYYGELNSIDIGIATKWKTLNFNFKTLDSTAGDSVNFELYGRLKNGTDSLLTDDVITKSGYDLSFIDAAKVSSLYIKALINDPIHYTPPQLRLWQVLYDGTPEGTLESDNKFIATVDTLLEGEKAKLNIKFKNISPTAMKPIIATLQLTDGKGKVVLDTLSFNALLPGQHFYSNIEINTLGLSGLVKATYIVNPKYAQPELTIDNNIFKWQFFIENDEIIPNMIVTFNNKIIKNGEIILATQTIKIEVKDDNKFRLLNDTSKFQQSLLYPGEKKAREFYFSNPLVKFSPSISSNSKALITITPEKFLAGKYLFTAQAKDANGNISGINPYSVTFNIVTEPSISKLLIYPVPVDRQAIFKYYIAGDKIPDQMNLVISNSMGQVVADIDILRQTKVQLGENAVIWDATDQSGSQLAPGIYVFRFVAKINNEEIKEYNYNIDPEIINHYGKFVIVR